MNLPQFKRTATLVKIYKGVFIGHNGPIGPFSGFGLDGTFDKKIIWAIMNEKAHLFSPVFGVRAEGNTNKANSPLGSHRTAQNSVLGHSRVLWATA